jgi:acetyl esterase/lipase
MDDEVAAMMAALDAGFPAVETMTPAQARAAIAARRQPVLNLDDVAAAEDRTVPGPGGELPVRAYHPHGESDTARPGVVFFHGGGFVFCDIESHDGFCRAMSRETGAVVVSVDYRRAPEHPAPAAAEDAVAAFVWVIDHARDLGIDPSRVAIAGDSAGGNLAAVAALICRDRKLPAPAAQALWYPVLDPACATDSYARRATGFVNTRAAMQWYWQCYLGEQTASAAGPVVAPARAASHADLPPALIMTVELDPLHDEGVAYAETLRRCGVRVVHRDFAGLFHGVLTMMTFAPARAARGLVFTDLRELLTTVAEPVS